ncbi:scavenger receptor cysteine-rich domain-containing protein DMBT1-like [Apostichopus japonicus]|uniref:scavenger receptor cysteine-rich domain-containing protein DMBT1-like n=1 Tax=Stichopus japonicus TaxID=307972 RepID=UPI003AB5EC72
MTCSQERKHGTYKVNSTVILGIVHCFGSEEEYDKQIFDLLQQPLYPRDCNEALTKLYTYNTGAGVYHIKPDGYADPFDVYCETDLENVVWTVLERRLDGSVGFHRTWYDYKNGFGFSGSEFWLGLEKIAYLTNQGNYQLRVDIFTELNITYNLHYDYFRITDEWGRYTLSSLQLHISNHIRLVNGTTHVEGRVEIYHNGQWGTVCGKNWDDNDASVACRQLGYSDTGIVTGNASYGEGTGPIWLENIACSGGEGSIEHCGNTGWGQQNCGHNEDAGLRCITVRLVGGVSLQEGRVEVYHDGQWGTICDDGWDDKDASVICRQLGYGDIGVGWQSAKFGEGSHPIWLEDVDCSGSEQLIEECGSNNWGVHSCGHGEDASVSCGTVRLVGSVSLQEGRVEVYHDGQWGTICDDGWDDNDASVICRQLGYGGIGVQWQSAKIGQGSHTTWLNNVTCSGSEQHIEECGSNDWGTHDCGHGEDASVSCRTVRLVGGFSLEEGRVEVYHDGQWGTICDDGWNDNDASVICRQLGYGGVGVGWQSAKFGEGSDPIWLENVACFGSEQHIEECGSNNWGAHDCRHGEDASVSCRTVRLVGGVNPREGRVEVYHDGQWGTICDDGWDDNDALVICRQLGYGDVGTGWQSAKYGRGSDPIWLDDIACSGSEMQIEDCGSIAWGEHNCGHSQDASVHCGTVRLVGGAFPQEGRIEVYHDDQWGTICDHEWDGKDTSVICRQLGYSDIGISRGNATFGEGSGQIWLDEMPCSGLEYHIQHCDRLEWGIHNCGHDEDAGVSCNTLRLVGGTSPREGRVEVYHDGLWGTICDHGWDDNGTSVICRQLGYGGIGTALQNSKFGVGSGPIWLDDVACSGSESHIENCRSSGWDIHNCGHHEDFAVHCGTVRLVGGISPREGLVKVYHDGQWGTICDEEWDDNNASLVCRQLGYGEFGIGWQSAQFGEASDQNLLDEVSYSGSRQNIENIGSRGWGEYNCDHSEYAGVSCDTVRLVEGNFSLEGRVEIYHDGEWGTICDDGWDDNHASVICRQLGYSNIGRATGRTTFGEGSGPIWLNEMSCSGMESNIYHCGRLEWGNHDCGHHKDAGVRCETVRLVYGQTSNEGRIEVYHDGQWGTICDDNWDDNDASVICRQLGFGSNGTAIGRAHFGEGSGEIWIDDAACSGHEANIEECGSTGWGIHDCGHGEDAGVYC